MANEFTFAEMKERCLLEINKGSNSDVAAVVPDKIYEAVIWLERNYSLAYMKELVTFTMAAAANNPAVAYVPSNPKSIHFIRRIVYGTQAGEQTFYPLTKVDPRDVTGTRRAYPSCYWLNARKHIYFDAMPNDEDTAYQLYYSRFTPKFLPSETYPDADARPHWLFDYGRDALLAVFMMQMAPFLRESRLLQLYQPMFETGIKTLLLADTEWEDENTSFSMEYGQDYG